MIKEHLKVGEKIIIEQSIGSTTGSFVNYQTPTPLAPSEFNSVSAKPDSAASILANKIIIFSAELVDNNSTE
jgi:hypothetical protein